MQLGSNIYQDTPLSGLKMDSSMFLASNSQHGLPYIVAIVPAQNKPSHSSHGMWAVGISPSSTLTILGLGVQGTELCLQQEKKTLHLKAYIYKHSA